MIRFCDKEIYKVVENGYSKGDLFTFFCSENHNMDIVGVFNEVNEFKGIITYNRLIDEKLNFEDIVQTEKVKTVTENIWEETKNLLRNNKSIVLLPVLNENNELIYFAYDDDQNNTSNYNIIMERTFFQIERMKDGLFLKDIYPKIESVFIYDLNEWAYRFYNICKERNIFVVVKGNKWKEILDIETPDISTPDYSKMQIYSEGTEMFNDVGSRINTNRIHTIYSFDFLTEILWVNRIFAQNEMKKKWQNQRKQILLCRIPRFHELKNHSIDEFYRNIRVHVTDIYSEDENIQKQFVKVCGDRYYKLKSIKKDFYEATNDWFNLADNNYNNFERKNTDMVIITYI